MAGQRADRGIGPRGGSRRPQPLDTPERGGEPGMTSLTASAYLRTVRACRPPPRSVGGTAGGARFGHGSLCREVIRGAPNVVHMEIDSRQVGYPSCSHRYHGAPPEWVALLLRAAAREQGRVNACAVIRRARSGSGEHPPVSSAAARPCKFPPPKRCSSVKMPEDRTCPDRSVATARRPHRSDRGRCATGRWRSSGHRQPDEHNPGPVGESAKSVGTQRSGCGLG